MTKCLGTWTTTYDRGYLVVQNCSATQMMASSLGRLFYSLICKQTALNLINHITSTPIQTEIPTDDVDLTVEGLKLHYYSRKYRR